MNINPTSSSYQIGIPVHVVNCVNKALIAVVHEYASNATPHAVNSFVNMHGHRNFRCRLPM